VEGLDEGCAPIYCSWTIAGGAMVARGKGLRVTGTLGVLEVAAERGLVDFAEAIRSLRRTSFRIPEAPLDSLLRKHESPIE
jgi:predicted nucleic acid-binding protein